MSEAVIFIPIAAAVARMVVRFIQSALEDLRSHEEWLQEQFTQQMRDQLRIKYPDRNIMIVGVPHDRHFVDEWHAHEELPLTWPRTKGYECYAFRSGTFQLNGDGGYVNWAFDGNFKRDGNSVTFYDLDPVVIPPPSVPPVVIPTKPAPAAGDGVFLVNSNKGDVWTSGLAWYRNVYGGDGRQPDAYIDIKTDGTVTWEGIVSKGTFQDGDHFWASVAPNAHDDTTAFGQVVGWAGNDYRIMVVHKDRWRVLYEIDGWKVYTVYWCS